MWWRWQWLWHVWREGGDLWIAATATPIHDAPFPSSTAVATSAGSPAVTGAAEQLAAAHLRRGLHNTPTPTPILAPRPKPMRRATVVPAARGARRPPVAR